MGCMPLLLLFQLHILIACEGSEEGISFPHRRWPQTKQGATKPCVAPPACQQPSSPWICCDDTGHDPHETYIDVTWTGPLDLTGPHNHRITLNMQS